MHSRTEATRLHSTFFNVFHGVAVSVVLCSTLFSSQATAIATSPIHTPLSVYSSYPSDILEAKCAEQYTRENCKDDAISPNTFVLALKNSEAFSSLHPFNEGSDYELLIANVGTSDGSMQSQYAEFTVQWRGLELDSFITASQTQNETDVNVDEGRTIAEDLVSQWLKHVDQSALFSSRFLFNALEASNYENSLQVPETVGEFTRLDTQLYADPFSGVITRYTHPTFEDALLDVSVYPILGPLNTEVDTLLNRQLDEDLEKANSVANTQQLTLSLPNPASPYSVNGEITGWRLGLKAESDSTPTIYASTYVFRREDKIIKVATTFPTDYSDKLVNELITRVEVPKESTLMKNVRSMLEESAQ